MSSRIAQTQIAQVSRVLREPAANIATFLKGCWRISISLWMAGIGQKLRELWRRRAGPRSSKGTKLYAVRDKKGQFKDNQTYKRAHGQDVKRKSKKEK